MRDRFFLPALLCVGLAACAASDEGQDPPPRGEEPAAQEPATPAPAAPEPTPTPAPAEPAAPEPTPTPAPTPTPDPVDHWEGELELPRNAAPEPRTSADRERGFEYTRAAAQDYVQRAETQRDERREKAGERWAKVAERATTATAESPIALEDGRNVVVTALDEDGFTIAVDDAEERHRWGTAPARLGFAVLDAATDPEDGEALYRLGLYALEHTLLDEAEGSFARAVEKDVLLKGRVPGEMDLFRRLLQLFRGEVQEDGDEVEVTWLFKPDRPEELNDFQGVGAWTGVEVLAAQLKVAAPKAEDLGVVLQGRWAGEAQLDAVVASSRPNPTVVVRSEDEDYEVEFGDEVLLRRFGKDVSDEVLARGELATRPGKRVALAVRVEGKRATLVASVAGEQAFSHEVSFLGSFSFRLGARASGEVRFGEVHCQGRLAPEWVEAVRSRGPARIAADVARRRRALDLPSRRRHTAPIFKESSGEDWFGADGVPELAKRAVAEARNQLASGNLAQARKKLAEAEEKAPEFAAVQYWLGLSHLRLDPHGALVRFEQASGALGDYYEALVGQARAQLLLGRPAAAGELIQAALDIRPDFVPVYYARTRAHVGAGKLQEAQDVLDLAEGLAEKDRGLYDLGKRLRALDEGPGWSGAEILESAHYRLQTDDPAQGRALLARLEALRRVYRERFGILADPAAQDERLPVLLIRGQRDYEFYAVRTQAQRSGASAAYFDPFSWQLVGRREHGAAGFHDLLHESFHQWVHRQGAALPPWLAEGVAEYVAGSRFDAEGGLEASGQVDEPLEGHLRTLVQLWKKRVPWSELMSDAPLKFFSGGLKYSQAWSVVHFICESGDAELREALRHYLAICAALREADVRRALGLKAWSHAYEQSFARLDVPAKTAAWEAWVGELAGKAGLELPGE